MRLYEGVFIFSPDSGPDARKEELQELDNLVKKFNGIIAEKNDWGRKTLGYEIKKSREAYIVVLAFQMDPALVVEFKRSVQLESRILKATIILKELRASIKKSVKKVSKSVPATKSTQETAAAS